MTDISRLRRFFINLFFSLFSKLMSVHGKKVFFLISIYYLLVKNGYMERTELEILNKRLSIATSTSAFRMPLICASYAWYKVDINTFMIEGLQTCDMSFIQRQQIAKCFVEHMPKWLKYTADDTMVSEVIVLLTAQKESP